ncbi:MAG: hypothetical protein WAX44_03095 [Minisyncoccia bacterium]
MSRKFKKGTAGMMLWAMLFVGVPILPAEMKWVISYETLAFATVDGDLDFNQYSPTGEVSKRKLPTYFIRTVPKGEGRVTTTDNIAMIQGKTQVGIACHKCAFYNEFRSKNGYLIREKGTRSRFQEINKRNGPRPRKFELVSLGLRTAEAAVAYNNTANSGTLSNLTSATWPHTTTGSNTYIVIGLAGWDSVDNIGSVTVSYNGDSLAELGGRQASAQNNSVMWGGLADTGTNLTVSVTNIPADYHELGGGSVSFTGVHQSASTGTLVSDSSEVNNPSVNITMVTGDMGVDILYSGANTNGDPQEAPVPGTSETQRVTTNFLSATDRKDSVMGTEEGNGTVTMDWTDSDGYDVSYSAIPILQAPPSSSAINRAIIRGAKIVTTGSRIFFR